MKTIIMLKQHDILEEMKCRQKHEHKERNIKTQNNNLWITQIIIVLYGIESVNTHLNDKANN